MTHTLMLENWWWGGLSYALCHLLHIAVWRAFPPRRQFVALLVVFYVPLVADLSWLTPVAALLHALLAANYIAIYPALQASSPTLRILLLLEDGLTESELLAALSSDRLLDERLADLRKSGLLVQSDGVWKLSRRGDWLASFFVGYRRFLGLPVGAG